MHQKTKDSKNANWVLNLANEAELGIDEDLKYELQEKLSSKKLKSSGKDLGDLGHFEEIEEGARRKAKAEEKVRALRDKYLDLQQEEKFKKISNSSFLTPEAASYLNEQLKNKNEQVDPEIVFAGQHQVRKEKKKHKRNLKYPQRYKNRTKKRRKH